MNRFASGWKPWVTLLARLILGGVLVYSGIAKIGNPSAFAQNIRQYQLGIPFDVTQFLGWSVPVFEIFLGALILLGVFTRVTGFLGAGMMLVFIGLIASLWIRGIAADCGCFGPGAPKTEVKPWYYAQRIAEDIGFALCGLWMMFFPRSPFSVDAWIQGSPATVTADTITDEETAR